MKFYYNNKLVRTSKTHEYKYALIWEGREKVEMCSGTREGCEKEITRRINVRLEAIENEKAIITAIKAGKNKYMCKEGRRSYYIELPTKDISEVEGWIENRKNAIEEIRKNLKLVELEARA